MLIAPASGPTIIVTVSDTRTVETDTGGALVEEMLVAAKVRQFAIAETQKFGHVTYFWNGNRSGYFDETLETYEEIRSSTTPEELAPEMQAEPVTDRLLQAMTEGYDFLRVNYANGDMVGHTGNVDATRLAVACVDRCLARLVEATRALGGVLIVTADHGEEFLDHGQFGHAKSLYEELVGVPLLIKAPARRGAAPTEIIATGVPCSLMKCRLTQASTSPLFSIRYGKRPPNRAARRHPCMLRRCGHRRGAALGGRSGVQWVMTTAHIAEAQASVARLCLRGEEGELTGELRLGAGREVEQGCLQGDDQSRFSRPLPYRAKAFSGVESIMVQINDGWGIDYLPGSLSQDGVSAPNGPHGRVGHKDIFLMILFGITVYQTCQRLFLILGG